jgi:hypothetical protein
MKPTPEVDAALSELMPYLIHQKEPLWEGVDATFSAWLHDTYGVPPSDFIITITPRVEVGFAAVAAGTPDGVFIYLLLPDPSRRKLRITQVTMGPYSQDAAISTRSQTAKDKGMANQVFDVVRRHLPQAVAIDLLIYEVH